MFKFIRTKKALKIAWEEVITDAVRYHYNRYKPEKVEIWLIPTKIFPKKIMRIMGSKKDKEIICNSLEDFINIIFKDQMRWNRLRNHWTARYFCDINLSFFARINSNKFYFFDSVYIKIGDIEDRKYPRHLTPVRQTSLVSFFTHSNEQIRNLAKRIKEGQKADFEQNFPLDYFSGPKELIKYVQQFTTKTVKHRRHHFWGTKQYLEIGDDTHYFNYRLTPKSYFKEIFEEKIQKSIPVVQYDFNYSEKVWRKNLEEKIWEQLTFGEKIYTRLRQILDIKIY